MATWEDPIDSKTDPDAPITSNLAKRWDNNVVALAEGSPGAPKIDGVALKGVVVSSVSSTSDTPIPIGPILRFDQMKLDISAFLRVNQNIQIRFSVDGGSSYGAWGSILSSGSSNTMAFSGTSIISVSGQSSTTYGMNSSVTPASGSVVSQSNPLIIPTNSNYMQLRVTDTINQSIYAIHVSITGGQG